MTVYLIDSNTIADFLSRQAETLSEIQNAMTRGDTLGLCRLRRLLWCDVLAKLYQFDRSIGLFSRGE